MNNRQKAEALMTRMTDLLVKLEASAKVCDQMSRNSLYRSIERVSALSIYQQSKLYSKITEKELYDPATDKWGFGPVVVSPCDFTGFIDDDVLADELVGTRMFDIKFWDSNGVKCHMEIAAATPELAKQRWADHFKGRGCDYDDMVEFTDPTPSVKH